MIFLYPRRYSILKIILFSATIFLMSPGRIQAQSIKDSAVTVMQNLSFLYRRKALSEKQYLDTVQEIMMDFQSKDLKLTNKELLNLLTGYREVIWEHKHNEKFKQAYYTILCNQARLDGRNGEMFYYAEKLSELEEHNNASSVTSLYYIVTYYYAHLAYSKAIALYNKNRRFITGIPQMILTQQLERRELMRSGDMIACFGMAAYKLRDSILAREIEGVMSRFAGSIRREYSADKEIAARWQYSTIISEHEKNLSLNLSDEVWKNIRQLDDLLEDPNTPGYLKSYIAFQVTDKKTLFFLDTKKNDSAGRYIDLLNQLYGDKLDPMNAYMVKKYEARLLYNKGFFRQSEDTLIKALEILEATREKTGAEIDEIMYALTKVEEQQFLLIDSGKKQKQSDRRLIGLGLGTFLLLSGTVFIYGVIRRRQKRRFVDFKFNLARNIHDEANPALLYAKMLAKKREVNYVPGQKDELETHIEFTMELIRSLSQDLKSEQQLTVGDLLLDVRGILEKMSVLSDFSYTIQDSLNKKRFLSYYQYQNLKAILQECITNSIKHAEFRHIDVRFTINVNVLSIAYNDDGSGWPDGAQVNGIGLQNMQERIKNLNGNFVISNNYPDGYRIDMDIRLS